MEKFYNSTKFINVSWVKEAVYPVYFTGNMADSAAVHRKPRKKSRPSYLSICEAHCIIIENIRVKYLHLEEGSKTLI